MEIIPVPPAPRYGYDLFFRENQWVSVKKPLDSIENTSIPVPPAPRRGYDLFFRENQWVSVKK